MLTMSIAIFAVPFGSIVSSLPDLAFSILIALPTAARLFG
jgi:hypothetical protein